MKQSEYTDSEQARPDPRAGNPNQPDQGETVSSLFPSEMQLTEFFFKTCAESCSLHLSWAITFELKLKIWGKNQDDHQLQGPSAMLYAHHMQVSDMLFFHLLKWTQTKPLIGPTCTAWDLDSSHLTKSLDPELGLDLQFVNIEQRSLLYDVKDLTTSLDVKF